MQTSLRAPRELRLLAPWLIAAIAAASLPSHAQDPADSGPRFAITAYQVDGNTLLPAAEVERLLAPYTGPGRAFRDVRLAVDALQQAYRRAGIQVVVVQLPEQELTQGVVRVKVVEPRIGRVRVEGNREFSIANIRSSLPGLREGATPNIRDISASLKVANTNPAKQTTLSLQGTDQPEVIDAVVR
ncbi:MAG: ShlB/FhaC/HecB family hemolysin secretion/activation protein, partial [Haliea sp.]